MTSNIYKIRRNGEPLGSWELHEIRLYISTGSIVPTDEVYLDESERWIPIIPPFRRKWNIFDWSDDSDEQWYYTHDGYIHGPRLAKEITLLHKGGYFDDSDLVTHFAQEEWSKINDWMELMKNSKDLSVSDHANEAFEKLNQGNTVGAGLSGMKAIGKLWGKLTEVIPATSEWLCIPTKPNMPSVDEISQFICGHGYRIINTESQFQEGKEHIAFCFESVEVATKVKTELDFVKVGEKYSLAFEDRIYENQ